MESLNNADIEFILPNEEGDGSESFNKHLSNADRRAEPQTISKKWVLDPNRH